MFSFCRSVCLNSIGRIYPKAHMHQFWKRDKMVILIHLDLSSLWWYYWNPTDIRARLPSTSFSSIHARRLVLPNRTAKRRKMQRTVRCSTIALAIYNWFKFSPICRQPKRLLQYISTFCQPVEFQKFTQRGLMWNRIYY